MLDNLRARFALAVLPRKADGKKINPFQVLATHPAGIPVYTDMTVRKATREGYKISISVYRAVRTIIQAASAIPWIVEDDKGEPIEGHDFAKTWAKPNPEFSGQDNMEFIIAHQLLCGNSLIQPVIVGGRPREFWMVMPDLVQPVPSDVPGEWLKAWRVNGYAGSQYDVPPGQFVHFMQIDPGNPYWGIGPLMAAARTIDTDNEAQDTQKISMQNRATPDGVFTHESVMTQEQFEEARRQIRENFLAKTRKREPWVLGAGAKWNQMSMTPVELDFIASRLSNKRDIAGAFGISPIFLGDLEQSSYNNMMEARKALYEDVVIPMLDDIKATLNLRIAPMYGNIVISYDTSKVAALRADYSKKVEQAKTLWAMGIPFDQINERLEMGFEEFPGWDRGYLPLTLLPTGATPAPAEEEAEKQLKALEKLMPTTLDKAIPWLEEMRGRVSDKWIDDAMKALNLQNEEQKTAHWKRIDRRRVGWWGVISKKIKPLYDAEAKAIEKALKGVKALSPQDWEEAYSDDPPHWAVDLTPSLFAQDFRTESALCVEDASVLEIGCGNGRDSIFFARAGIKVTAIDVAPSAIKLAKENAKEAEVSIDFRVANAEELPFEDGEFGAVFSLSVLHATELKKSMAEVSRVLKENMPAFVYIYGDTQFADGKREEVITVDGYVKLVESLNFKVLDFYDEQEETFDEFGEKHLIIVSLLQKVGEPK